MTSSTLDGLPDGVKSKQDLSEAIALNECATQLHNLFNFETLAFMLISEADQSFQLRLCEPPSQAESIQYEVDKLIEQGVFAWALDQSTPVFEKAGNDKVLVLHSLSTRTRLRGMFIGICGDNNLQSDTRSRDFLSVILFSTSNTLENLELYQCINEHNEHLEETIRQRTEDLEKARKAAEAANEAKTQFLANISHEIRTPLTSILGYADLIRHGQLSPSEQDRAVTDILQVTAHLSGIINNILDISKIEADKLEIELIPTSLFSLLNSVTAIIQNKAEEKGLRFSIDYHFPLPETIHTDPTRLKQILLNLCNNAVKFTHTGHITIEVRYVTQPNRMVFSVIDTGVGVSKDMHHRLFDKFVQADSSISRSYGGTGLGLAISKQLAQKLGGDITLDSTPGHGSRFDVTIDIGDIAPTSLVYNQTQLPEQQTKKVPWSLSEKLYGRVLLAEDNVSSQQLIGLFLTKAGITVDVVDNGKIAVEQALKNSYDLLLMDMQMPEMNGFEATRLLRDAGYPGAIVALTANATVDIKRQCHDAGFDGFLSKPIEVEEFFETLRHYLKSRETKTSSNLLDDPDFQSILEEFIEYLPDAFEDMEKAYRQNDWPRLKTLAHRLKGVAGGYGFPEIGLTAATIEADVAAENYVNLADLLKNLHTSLENHNS